VDAGPPAKNFYERGKALWSVKILIRHCHLQWMLWGPGRDDEKMAAPWPSEGC
jgi:hypothetical protein